MSRLDLYISVSTDQDLAQHIHSKYTRFKHESPRQSSRRVSDPIPCGVVLSYCRSELCKAGRLVAGEDGESQ